MRKEHNAAHGRSLLLARWRFHLGPTSCATEQAGAPPNGRNRPNGDRKNYSRKIAADRTAKEHANSDNAVLKARLSAVLRDQLLGELKEVNSVDAAAVWARRILPAKNSLNIADARQLESAFQARLAALELEVGNTIRNHATPLERKRPKKTETSTIERIEKSGPTHPEPRRVRDREHVKFVAGHPCLICGRRPADPHHLRFAQSRALGRRVSDEFTVPLCRGHHREVHRYGDEAAWWAKAGVEPLRAANALWRETHPRA
jgi:hypothetical protein